MTSHSLQPFHPLLAEWFADSFGEPTDVQKRAWRAIKQGHHTLIAAPTGSGKTLAALLPCLDAIVSSDETAPGVRVLYVTPLKALNNDIHHHALRFIEELDARAAAEGRKWRGIRSGVRTGDTPQSQRAAMQRRPPDVLVTTPESLFLLLASDKGRAMLRTVRQVIVDEIHDLAAGKRGAHLSLSLERLAELCDHPVQRIGVSATQKPLERVARYLGGWEEAEERELAAGLAPGNRSGEGVHSANSIVADQVDQVDPIEQVDLSECAEAASPADLHPLGYRPRPVAIVESDMQKQFDLTVTMPDQSRPVQSREAVWLPLLDRIVQLMEGTRSVLVFVNSRRLCERLCLRLNDHVGYELARSHHGSVSRERRLEVERLLKEGSLRCIVATSSLELGIDVGHVDLVIQIDSPLSAASGIQRIGRAGHAVGDASRGVILARSKGPLPEIAALSRKIATRDIEEIRVPYEPLDVLSQQIVGMVAASDWKLDHLHRLVARSENYYSCSIEQIEEILQVLSGMYPFVRPLLEWDRTAGLLTKRANTAMATVTGAGTIPQSGNYPVHHIDSRVHLGELDEEFIQESRVGDVFQLGTSSWMIREIKHDRVYVSDVGNRFSEVPFWRNEAGGRSYTLGVRVGEFMRELGERLRLEEIEGELETATLEETLAWLATGHGMDREAGNQLALMAYSQQRFCGLPTDKRMLIEHYKDVMNQTHVVLHNYCGRSVNRAWLLAIERQFEKLLPYRLYGNAKDNGIEFVLPEWDASWLQAIHHVTPANLEQLLTEAVTGSPLLALSFRRIAETSLLLSRSFNRTPLWQKRLRGEELLRSALPYADRFPYLREAMKECLYDYLDYEGLKLVLEGIQSGEIDLVTRETPHPSPFAAQFIADYVNMRIYEGEGVDETIQLQLMNVSKELAAQLFGEANLPGVVRPEIVREEGRRLEEPERTAASAKDVYRLLKQRGDLTAEELIKLTGGRTEALGWLEELRESGRVTPIDLSGDGAYRWICADERGIYEHFPESGDSVSFVIGRYVKHLLSFTEAELCERYPALTYAQARQIVEAMLAQGQIERAPHAADEKERIWTSVEVASRLVRLSIRETRKQSEPVDPSRWCGQIALLQHALQGTQQQGTDGLRRVIGIMQGLFAPLSHWETILFPSRVTRYRKEDLDLLCASGDVIWLGQKEEGDKEGKVAFFLAESKELYAPYVTGQSDKPTQHPRLLEKLRKGGASFLTKLSREEGKTPSELLPDLLDLVWEGHVSNDQFAPLRLSQVGKSRKATDKTGSGFGRWYWTGALVEEEQVNKGSGSSGNKPQQPVANEQSAVHWAHHLLHSFGMVNKDLVAAVSPFAWDAFYPIMKRLEDWGAVIRGSYVQGDESLQFTTREVADAVRRPLAIADAAPITVLSAADPANPYGLLIDWPAAARGAFFARKAGNYLVLRGESGVFWIENNGRRVFTLDIDTIIPLDQKVALLKDALFALLRRQGLVKVVIDSWNGEPIVSSEAGKLLLELGAETDRKSLVFWAN